VVAVVADRGLTGDARNSIRDACALVSPNIFAPFGIRKVFLPHTPGSRPCNQRLRLTGTVIRTAHERQANRLRCFADLNPARLPGSPDRWRISQLRTDATLHRSKSAKHLRKETEVARAHAGCGQVTRGVDDSEGAEGSGSRPPGHRLARIASFQRSRRRQVVQTGFGYAAAFKKIAKNLKIFSTF
jgi:hypothetical protein